MNFDTLPSEIKILILTKYIPLRIVDGKITGRITHNDYRKKILMSNIRVIKPIWVLNPGESSDDIRPYAYTRILKMCNNFKFTLTLRIDDNGHIMILNKYGQSCFDFAQYEYILR